MQLDDYNLDKKLHDTFADKTAEVPGFIWEKIEKEIAPKKKRGFFFWLLPVGIILATLYVTFQLFKGSTLHAESLAKTLDRFPADALYIENLHKKIGQNKTKQNEVISPEVESKTNQKIASTFSFGDEINKTKKSNSLRTKKVRQSNSKGEKSGASSNLTSPFGTKSFSEKGGEELANTGTTEKNDIENQGSNQKDNEKTKDEFGNLNDVKKNVENGESLDTLKPIIDELPPDPPVSPKPKKNFLQFSIASSKYDVSLYKPYFNSGALSNRDFTSKGFALDAGYLHKFIKRWSVSSTVSYNSKETQFKYDILLHEVDFFKYQQYGKPVPIANLDKEECNKGYLLKDASAAYQIHSVFLNFALNYQTLSIGRFQLENFVYAAPTVLSALKVNNSAGLSGIDSKNEFFNSIVLGFGITPVFQCNERVSLGLQPKFQWQFARNSFYAKPVKELLIPVMLRVSL
jgi:hypothetical protein